MLVIKEPGVSSFASSRHHSFYMILKLTIISLQAMYAPHIIAHLFPSSTLSFRFVYYAATQQPGSC